MHPDEPPTSEQPEPSSGAGDVPAIEDAYEADSPGRQPVEDNEAELLVQSAQPLGGEGSQAQVSEDAATPPSAGDHDDVGDVESLPGETVAGPENVATPPKGDIDRETSARRVIVELRRIEVEVRALLEDRDTKRKRKLGGTHRWLELEEDLINWRFTDRFDKATLDRLHELIVRRNYLFRHLRYLAATRPVWNS